MITDEPRVTVRDCRSFGMCSSGLRAFAAKHGIEWQRFITEGIPVSELEGIDDAMLKQVVDKVRG
jgi:hypothetical protein